MLLKKIIPFFLILYIVYACSKNKRAVIQTTAGSDSIMIIEENDAYYHLKGTLGDEKITVHLLKNNELYNGIYFKDSDGRWIHLDTQKKDKDSIYLFEYVNGDLRRKNGRWVLKFNLDSFSGYWISHDGKDKKPVKLVEEFSDESLALNYQKVSDSIAGFENNPFSPYAYFDYGYVGIPTGESEIEQWINKELKIIFNESSSNKSLNTIIEEKKLTFFENFKNAMKENIKDEKILTVNHQKALNFRNYLDVVVYNNQNNLFALRVDNYTFSGGSHGYYNSSFYNFDLETKKYISLSDLFSDDPVFLNPIIELNFRESYQIPDSISLKSVLFEDKISYNSNFVIGTNGIGFVYNPNEIASFSTGQLYVYIPYLQLSAYLKPEFIERMDLTIAE